MRGETPRGTAGNLLSLDFNPLPSYEGRQVGDFQTPIFTPISIHSPHARGDRGKRCLRIEASDFNPLPSCEGRPSGETNDLVSSRHFNPLPSHEGRRCIADERPVLSNFNPLPSHEGRPFCPLRHCPRPLFQSTPLMRGETRSTIRRWRPRRLFQSTPLIQGETRRGLSEILRKHISIRSPHARGDNWHAGRR